MKLPERTGYSFPPRLRIRRSREFSRVRREGKRISTRHFVIYWLEKTDGPSRLGLTVSRKVGGAVERNWVKRLVREFFRLHRETLPPHVDFSVIGKIGAAKLDFEGVRGELICLQHKPPGARTSS